MATVHVVGAGLAGLASAVRLAQLGVEVALYEAAQQAGGRCRSYPDRALGRLIDNGNHLLLSGNRSALAYLEAIGAKSSLLGPEEACFPFLDLASGERWTVRPNRGRIPFWIAVPSRRVPRTSVLDYLAAWPLARARENQTVADCLGGCGRLWRAFWDPLARAVLNTPPETGSARLLWAALRESFAEGGAGCRPLIARESLAASLIDPALRLLEGQGVKVAFGHRLRTLERAGERVGGLDFVQRGVVLGPGDRLILALPPGQIGELLPEIPVPSGSHAIVNGHFVLPAPVRLPERSVLLGLVGGTAQWLFVRGELASLTVSAADELAEEPAETVAAKLWRDTARALGLAEDPQPPGRIVKERRATFAQTPAAARARPGATTPLEGVYLAGDWTATGLPATIESAVRSGFLAADLAARGDGAKSL
ncbi:MAG: hydroxysqualene dehydroxylase HpnE [Geminicoccaceae bacterium]